MASRARPVGAIVHTRRIAAHEHPAEPGGAGGGHADEQITGSLERVSAAEEAHGSRSDELRDIAFPIALRGYEREAVDAYIERVLRIVAELEASRSPAEAVRRALDQVGEETSGILQRAQETASEITARSRAQADDRLREAEREATEITADAEERVRVLDADFARVWDQRDRLLEEVRGLAERLLKIADDAEDRWAPQAEESWEPHSENPGEADARGDTASIPALGGEELARGEPPGAVEPQGAPDPATMGDPHDFVEVYDRETDRPDAAPFESPPPECGAHEPASSGLEEPPAPGR